MFRKMLEELMRRHGREWIPGDGDNAQKWDGYGDDDAPRRPVIRIPKWSIVAVVILVVFVLAIPRLAVFYTDLLWYSSHGLSNVIWVRLIPQWILFFGATAAAFLVYWLNWRSAWRNGTEGLRAELGNPDITPIPRIYPLLFAAILGVMNGFGVPRYWSVILRFIHAVPFPDVDPVFGNNVGFYVFSLPFWQFLQEWLSGVFFVSIAGSVLIYLLTRSLRFNADGKKIDLVPGARLHLTLIASCLIFTWGAGLWLQRFELLFSSTGVVYGMGYTDISVRLPALTMLSVAAFAAGLLLLANFFRPMWKLSVVIVGLLVVVGWIAQSLLPSLVQEYVVRPNEYEKEKTYLEYHIGSTRRAFGLDKVKIFSFTPSPEVTAAEVKGDFDTVENIRLWDYDPLLRTYKQLQEIRTYYDFSDVDIDRYDINGRNRQVMLSVRELDLAQLQNPTWVNSHLEFTHGYGVVMNPVNEMSEGGLPIFFMKDLPPKSTVPIPIDKPQIYYGEKPSSYALVNTDVKEFDYPMGDANMRSTYAGEGGISIGSLWRRILFALRYRDTEILFTGSLKPESRIMYFRNVREAIREVAPFLLFEDDVYPIIENGRILWVQDAYTATNMYPYSRPVTIGSSTSDLRQYAGVNYIRNSAKIVVDAYDGKMTFYVSDPSDPLIKNWMKVFPDLFTPIEKASPECRAHFRYPEEFFEVQSDIYRIYHMTDTNTYYNKEDVWMTAPQGQEKRINPNYVTMQLQGETSPEFALIAPFMPVGRNNLIGWMAGRCDPAHYGELVVYQFPKQELVFGPAQINALIDQNPDISAQLSLWSQRGSDVIRGDLLVIPIGKSLLYVQPIYLKAEKGDLPELKRITLSTGGRVVWAETFDAALDKLLGETGVRGKQRSSTSKPAKSAVAPVPPESAKPSSDAAKLAEEARAHYDAAQTAIRAGDWAKYGEEIKKLGETIEKMQRDIQ